MRGLLGLVVALTVGVQFTVAQYTATYDPNNLPPKTEQDQTGTNQCGTGSSQTSMCQNVYVNSLDDFCLWGPPDPNSSVGGVEQIVVAWCTKPGRGTRVFPEGTIKQAHFLKTPDYVQVTGVGDFTKTNIAAGDTGGELDPHGPDGFGNPHGGLVFSNVFGGSKMIQVHEWTNFMSVDEFCIRVCDPAGPRAAEFCQHEYDIQGCKWNIPGQYDVGFDTCQGDDVIPMGLYPQPDGSTSTYHQYQGAAPPAQPPAPSSNCKPAQSTDLFAQATTAGSSSGSSGNATTTRGGSGPGPTSSSPPAGSAGASIHADGMLTLWICLVVGAMSGLAVLL